MCVQMGLIPGYKHDRPAVVPLSKCSCVILVLIVHRALLSFFSLSLCTASIYFQISDYKVGIIIPL